MAGQARNAILPSATLGFHNPQGKRAKWPAEETSDWHREWLNTIPKTDYAAICVAIEAHRRDQSRKESVR